MKVSDAYLYLVKFLNKSGFSWEARGWGIHSYRASSQGCRSIPTEELAIGRPSFFPRSSLILFWFHWLYDVQMLFLYHILSSVLMVRLPVWMGVASLPLLPHRWHHAWPECKGVCVHVPTLPGQCILFYFIVLFSLRCCCCSTRKDQRAKVNIHLETFFFFLLMDVRGRDYISATTSAVKSYS